MKCIFQYSYCSGNHPRRFSAYQRAQLEKMFVRNCHPSFNDIECLAEKTGLTEQQVTCWFHNRRTKESKENKTFMWQPGLTSKYRSGSMKSFATRQKRKGTFNCNIFHLYSKNKRWKKMKKSVIFFPFRRLELIP